VYPLLYFIIRYLKSYEIKFLLLVYIKAIGALYTNVNNPNVHDYVLYV
jgi:hypothetical protein